MVNLHELVLDSSEFIPKNVKDYIVTTEDILPSLRSLEIADCSHIRSELIMDGNNLLYILEIRKDPEA